MTRRWGDECVGFPPQSAKSPSPAAPPAAALLDLLPRPDPIPGTPLAQGESLVIREVLVGPLEGRTLACSVPCGAIVPVSEKHGAGRWTPLFDPMCPYRRRRSCSKASFSFLIAPVPSFHRHGYGLNRLSFDETAETSSTQYGKKTWLRQLRNLTQAPGSADRCAAEWQGPVV